MSSAKRRASPGPAVARTSTSQPPRRRVSRTAVTARASVRAAAGFVMSRARVTSVSPLPEQVEPHLPPEGLLQQRIDTGADRLDTPSGTPFRVQTHLEPGAERIAERHWAVVT